MTYKILASLQDTPALYTALENAVKYIREKYSSYTLTVDVMIGLLHQEFGLIITEIGPVNMYHDQLKYPVEFTDEKAYVMFLLKWS